MSDTSDNQVCAEAQELIDRAWVSEDPDTAEALLKQAHALLVPLVSRGVSHAQYLCASGTLSTELKDEDEFEKRYLELIEAASKQGHAKAQFHLGQAYDNGGDLGHHPELSAYWFRLSAEQGYCYAQWVHGLNLMNGTGVARNVELGLEYIQRAADGKFEGALQFVADAYAEGKHGYPKDSELSQMWRAKLSDPDVIGYRLHES
jgi:uncharacterized protein